MTFKNELEKEIAYLIVEVLNLEDINPDDIDPEAALFGEGLGLDSIDALEMSMEINKKYGVELRADNEDNEQIFASLRSLADYVGEHRS